MLIEGMEWADKLSLNLEDLYTYAKMRRMKTINKSLSGNDGQSRHAFRTAGSALSFIVPKYWLFRRKINSNCRDPRLKLCDHFLRMFYVKEHVLSPEEESYRLEAGELAAPSTIFSMANDADLKIGYIKDEKAGN